MSFEEAIVLYERIKNRVIGAPVNGRLIESLFIGPTNWDEMHIFMNTCLEKGEKAAISEFFDKSFSVYGKSVSYTTPSKPTWDVTNLDGWDKAINN